MALFLVLGHESSLLYLVAKTDFISRMLRTLFLKIETGFGSLSSAFTLSNEI